jgi:hypothetical protein
MGEGDQRSSKRVVRYASRDLARISRRLAPSEAEWDAKNASGTAKAVDAALISRTATLDDPLTTSLLAEVARRSMTIDVSPDQIDEATEIEPGDRDTVGTTDDPSRDPSRDPA